MANINCTLACLALLVVNLLPESNAAELTQLPAGVYEIKAETELPNLRESLRYATTHTKQCLNKPAASSLFPVLKLVSFVGCDLVANDQKTNQNEFELVCENAQAAYGKASFEFSKNKFYAVLSVKMGGKNMRFSQRVTGNRVSACN